MKHNQNFNEPTIHVQDSYLHATSCTQSHIIRVLTVMIKIKMKVKIKARIKMIKMIKIKLKVKIKMTKIKMTKIKMKVKLIKTQIKIKKEKKEIISPKTHQSLIHITWLIQPRGGSQGSTRTMPRTKRKVGEWMQFVQQKRTKHVRRAIGQRHHSFGGGESVCVSLL